MTERAERINGWAAMIGVIVKQLDPMQQQVKSFLEYGDGISCSARDNVHRIQCVTMITQSDE